MRLLGRSELRVELVELLAEVARTLARDLRAFPGDDPVALSLDHVELGRDGLRRPMRRDPGELVLGALGVGAQVLVRIGVHRALTCRVEPVEGGVSQRRGHRVGADHGPHQGRSNRLRPHPIAYGGEEKEGDKESKVPRSPRGRRWQGQALL